MSGDTGNISPRPVAVVVPVYGNLEATRNCIESVITSDLPEYASIIVIDDHSPEEAVSAYCRELTQRSSIQLIVNEVNLGFVGTANKGLGLDTDADIILLNSDTVVSSDWIKRLQACAYRQDNIGTVTPFSNNGTICSYPVFMISNSMPKLWNPAELDQAFQSGNSGLQCEIPTAVGFCMYIKRSCLNATGTFDEDAFGHGYGEECDFSLRASAMGWKHVIAADVFVYHEGAASFASESADRKSFADGIMNDLHPNYHELVSEFIARDPLYLFRRNVDAIRLDEKPADANNILEEQYRYTRNILDLAKLARKSLLDEQRQRQHLETLLANARLEFTATDGALHHAEKVVNQLNSDLKQSGQEISNLLQSLRVITESRSWRYTAWLRRK